MEDLTVAVTGLNATDNPGPGVAVVTALRADPSFQGKVIGLAYDALDPGLYREGLLDAAFLVPYPSAGRGPLFERLAAIKQSHGLDVIIPTLDAELPAFLDQEGTLSSMGIDAFLPTRSQFDRRSKARLDDLKKLHNIPVPKAEVITDPEPLFTAHERFEFPLVIKGVFYGATITYSVDEAVKAFHAAAAKWGLPVIVQQFVPGEEYNVCALGDGRGGMVGAVAMKKLMVTEAGKGWAGVTIADPSLMRLSADIIRALDWRGPCEIECRRDPDGGWHLLEINPRFPAWCDLTAGAGQNLISACVRLARGEPVPPLSPYRVGTAFVRIATNQILPLSAMESLFTHGQLVPEAQP